MASDAPCLQEHTVVVESIIYSSPDGVFAIFEARPRDGDKKKTFVAKGRVGSIRVNELLLIRGEWITDPKYGHQFQVESMELPDFKAGGIKYFLTAGYLKGIGPALATSIYDEFGEDTARVLDEEPERLLKIKGVGEAKLRDIQAGWEEHSGKREVLAHFGKMGFTPKMTQKIIAHWQNPRDAIRITTENPYLLAWEISGVGFAKADEIAQKQGFELLHPYRIEAAISYVLDQASKCEGHCYLLRPILFQRVSTLVSPGEEVEALVHCLSNSLERLAASGLVVLDTLDRVYLPKVYRSERELEDNIFKLCNAPLLDPGEAQSIDEYQHKAGTSLHEMQIEAVLMAHQNNVHIITGGPGTGKTTVIKALLATRGKNIQKVKLCAPTGKAAKRMQESTGYKASTIHRMLEFSPENGGFLFKKSNPLDADLVIVDEVSMLDVFTARALTDAIRPGCKLVLIGDQNQLPSVGAGNVLRDMLDTDWISRTMLTKIFRQAADSNLSLICLNAAAMLRGSMPGMNLDNAPNSDFFWLGIEEWTTDETPSALCAEYTARRVMAGVHGLLQNGFLPSDIQVLTPMRKGPLGTQSLNILLQNKLNPEVPRTVISGIKSFSPGDRVMQLRNNYDKEIFNGDQGIIQSIDPKEQQLLVQFDDRVVELEFKDVDDLELSYAITIHKSQGSESPAVIIPVIKAHHIMLTRSLLYTAITRAKNMCVLAGQIAALQTALWSNKASKRNTFLWKAKGLQS